MSSSSSSDQQQQQQPKSGVDFIRNLRQYTTQQTPVSYQFDQNTPPPEYLEIEEEGSNRILEQSMGNIGRAYIGSLGIGAMHGIYRGIRYGQGGSVKIRINSILNQAGIRSVKLANSVAAGLIFYYMTDIGMFYFGKKPESEEQQKAREEKEATKNIAQLTSFNVSGTDKTEEEEKGVDEYDELKNSPVNAFFAGMLTGLVYVAPAPFAKIVRGSLVGASLALANSIYIGRFDPFTPLENNTWMRDWVMPIYHKIAPERFTTLFRELKNPNGTKLYPKFESLISSRFSERVGYTPIPKLSNEKEEHNNNNRD
ncbi:hypothetical protein C9374_001751 [Naegleria lovaniensis]|uniref:Uncharacterized protein n=1 Tax=Naegleria lovaniensis TaxID=51637 RepID=A0AA88GWJ2_NAELO|nr:uncharacterized protein C9374_001751 [Naegleria lovaniensis]KAG2387419.1 hypothetical protein C9374_001751 [Naegleria lovaniensis]